MSNLKPIARAAALSLISLLAAGGLRPVEAQKVTAGRIATGILNSNAGIVSQFPQGTMVHSPVELVTTLSNPPTTGIIIIPRDVQWDMSAYSAIEGLHLRGPEAGNLADSQKAARAIFVHEDADQQLGRRIVIPGNELNEWTAAGVELRGAHADAALPGEYDPSSAVLRPADAGLVRVEGNYIRNNGRGYGVVVDSGAYVTIEGNVFNYNWHDVTSDGRAHSGYVAQYIYVYNYVLAGGFEYNVRPIIGGYYHNVMVHSDFGAAIRLDTGDDSSLDDDDPGSFNLHAARNQFGTDHSTEIAAGDFDGDGVTDVFLATSTAWFYSRGGSQPWTYLQPSGLLTRDLAFADVDHDGVTDVLWRGPNGVLYYWKGGKGNPIAPTSVPVSVSEIRFGDFDGDGKTDLFYTQGGVWNFFYSRTHTWSAPNGSSFPVTDLLFADVDGDGKTDILGVSDNHWSYSSGGTQPWSSLNDALTNSFHNAVIGDFEGTGRNAILFSANGNWHVSRGGIGPARVWRAGGDPDPYASLKSTLLGHFDGGGRTELVSFEHGLDLGLFGNSITTGNRLVIVRGADRNTTLTEFSPLEMR
jgi:hypothetical protein